MFHARKGILLKSKRILLLSRMLQLNKNEMATKDGRRRRRRRRFIWANRPISFKLSCQFGYTLKAEVALILDRENFREISDLTRSASQPCYRWHIR